MTTIICQLLNTKSKGGIVNRAFSIHFFTALTSRNTICSRTREELYSVYKMVKKDHFLWKRMKKMSWYFFFFLPNRMSIHWLWHGAVHGIFYANFLTWFLYARKLGRQDVGTGRRVAVTSDLLRFDLHFYFLLFWYIHTYNISFAYHTGITYMLVWWSYVFISPAFVKKSHHFCFSLFLLFRIFLIIYRPTPDGQGHVKSRHFIGLLFLTILFH